MAKLLAYQLLLSHFNQLAEATTGIINDQLERRDIFLPSLQRQPLQFLRRVLYVVHPLSFYDRPDGICLTGVVLLYLDLFQHFRGVFDDDFSVFLEICGGEEIHSVEDGRIETV